MISNGCGYLWWTSASAMPTTKAPRNECRPRYSDPAAPSRARRMTMLGLMHQ